MGLKGSETLPRITAIICTFNRAALLEGALLSLVHQTLNPELFEIVVVDNACTDQTEEKVRTAAREHPEVAINLVREGTPGLVKARHTGIAAARANIVAFLDDDARAAPEWLQVLVDCFDNITPAPSSVGGPVIPILPPATPAWFKPAYETDTWGDESRFLNAGESFSGDNMAFRKSIISEHGGFDARVEMRGSKMAVADETNLYRRIWEKHPQSALFYYSTKAVMYHVITANKLSVSYILKRQFAAGQAYFLASTPVSWSKWMARLRDDFRKVARGIARFVGRRRGFVFWQQWFVEELSGVCYHAGAFVLCLGFRIKPHQR